MTEWMWFLFAGISGYFAGSVPFGLVITRMAGLGDIRDIGSGNIGATNVLRTGRKDLAIITLLLDSLKAGLVALAFNMLAGPNLGMVAGAMAFVGHCYPVWLKFKGGKGVATYAGLLPFVSLPGFFIALPTWIALVAITRISSLAALVAAALVVPGAWLLGERREFILIGLACLSIFVFFTHRSNLARLLKGEEPRFGGKKADKTAE